MCIECQVFTGFALSIFRNVLALKSSLQLLSLTESFFDQKSNFGCSAVMEFGCQKTLKLLLTCLLGTPSIWLTVMSAFLSFRSQLISLIETFALPL